MDSLRPSLKRKLPAQKIPREPGEGGEPRIYFNPAVMKSVIGGLSAIDLPRLNIHTLEAAEKFLEGYGFSIKVHQQVEKLWKYHRRSLVLLQDKLGIPLKALPEVLTHRDLLGDLRWLLIWASSKSEENLHLQRWSCSLLRVMHVFVHAENDFSSSFAEEIQSSILNPIEKCIYHDGKLHKIFLRGAHENVELSGFEVKPLKTSSSTAIKLLAKSNILALHIYDRVGIRFVTKNIFNSFRVLRFLIEENLISYPHIMPDQSSNLLYPLDLFLEACMELTDFNQSTHQRTSYSDQEIQDHLMTKLKNHQDRGPLNFVRRENFFSAHGHRFIKFIARKLIHSQGVFFPYEVQIMDEESHLHILSGPAEHRAYKDRQIQAARRRVFPYELNLQNLSSKTQAEIQGESHHHVHPRIKK